MSCCVCRARSTRAKITQPQCIDKVVDDFVVQVPRVQVLEKTVQIPQLPSLSKSL